MKTITVKLPEDQAIDLNKLIKTYHYTSKSELIRDLIREKMETKLSKKTIEDIKESIREIRRGETISLEDVEKEYGL